jgi:hypothetical protein
LGHAKPFPPEPGPNDPAKEFDGAKGKIRWQSHTAPSGYVDLKKFFAHGDAGVAYALCWFRTDRKKAVLATGSDDGIKVWIDSKIVLDKPAHRDAVPGDDLTPIDIRGDWREMLVKVDNRYDTWGFYLELRDPATGKPIENVAVRFTPPSDDTKGFIREWQLLGPFVNEEGRGHAKVYAPEEAAFDAGKEYDGRNGKILWKQYRSEQTVIDLVHALKVKPQDAAGVAYAVSWVRSDRKRAALLSLGSDDGVRVWIDRKIIHDKAVERPVEPGSDKVPFELHEGWNEIRVKVDNKSGPWGFVVELRDPNTGRPLTEGVEFKTTPP